MYIRKLIISKDVLIDYKDKILNLFLECFESELSEKLWNWAYMDNPNGDPIVSLYFDEKDKLIAHYAVIPILLVHKQKEVRSLLSMTTMVHKEHRKRGIFIEQAGIVYDEAIAQGYKLVYGFPNKNSAPGFLNKLGWTLEQNLFVTKLTYDELRTVKVKEFTDSISFNIRNESNNLWRISKPNQIYFNKGNSILKDYGSGVDIVFDGSNYSDYPKDKVYYLLIDGELDNNFGEKEFNYIFGYKLFDRSLIGVDFKKDLIMSDVF